MARRFEICVLRPLCLLATIAFVSVASAHPQEGGPADPETQPNETPLDEESHLPPEVVRASQPDDSTPAVELIEEPAGGPGFPIEALQLLNQSSLDSCAVCARRNRSEAFEILDRTHRPGKLIATTSDAHFIRVPGGENELSLTSYALEGPILTFRFHTSEKHLIGIADTDQSDPSTALAFAAAGGGERLIGLLELVEYAYGDGPTYLYSPTQNHLQFQCKILDLGPE